MGIYQVGEVIRRTRESMGITQEKLSDGICSVENLSRIETGKVRPNRNTFEKLMERLGRSGEKYLPFVRGEDMETHILRDKVGALIGNCKYEEMEPFLDKLEEKLDMTDPINKQYILRVRALADYYLGKTTEKEKRVQLEYALRCTLPDYQDGILPRQILTRIEVFTYCNIAVSYAEEGNLEKAIVMLRQIEKYFQIEKIDSTERAISEALALSNLAQCLGRQGRYIEARSVHEKVKKICIDNKRTSDLTREMYNIAYDDEMLDELEEMCKTELLQAYYVARLCKNTTQIEHIRKHVKEIYKDDFLKEV